MVPAVSQYQIRTLGISIRWMAATHSYAGAGNRFDSSVQDDCEGLQQLHLAYQKLELRLNALPQTLLVCSCPYPMTSWAPTAAVLRISSHSNRLLVLHLLRLSVTTPLGCSGTTLDSTTPPFPPWIRRALRRCCMPRSSTIA